MKVFVGYDTREDIAYQVCKHSILSKQPAADVRPLKQQELRDAGWYKRDVDKLASTEFTFTRFNTRTYRFQRLGIVYGLRYDPYYRY